MSKMPVDRDEKQKEIFRRFGIPKLRNEDTPKPEYTIGKEAQAEEKPKRK